MDGLVVARGGGRPRKEAAVKDVESPTKVSTQLTLECTRVNSFENEPNPNLQMKLGEISPSVEGSRSRTRWADIIQNQPEQPPEHRYEAGKCIEVPDPEDVRRLLAQVASNEMQQPSKQPT